MSYANWNPTQFYLVDDIVIYNGEDYQALADNTNTIPSGAPLVWNPIAPPGPGPSNQLAFNQATTQLSIVGGNSVNISPLVQYTGNTDPSTATLSVGNTTLGLPSVPTTYYEDALTTQPNPVPIYLKSNPTYPNNPVAPYRWLEFHWMKSDPTPPLKQDKVFSIETGDGYTRMKGYWSSFPFSLMFQGSSINVETPNGAGGGIKFDSRPFAGPMGPVGNLYQDALGDLYWNGTKLN